MYNLPWYIFWGLWLASLLSSITIGGLLTIIRINAQRDKQRKEWNELTRKMNNVSDHK